MLPLRVPMLVASVFTTFVAANASAQNVTYKRGVTDTLRYREVTHSSISIMLPQGSLAQSTKHDATIGLMLGAGESARAWYEALSIEQSSAQGVKKPAVADVLGKPFTLTIDARGIVKVLGTPVFSNELNAVSDLRHQFDDFLIRLPAKPLTKNMEWMDTSKTSTTDSTGRYSRMTSVVRYRVLSDTTVNAERGVVVLMVQNVSLEAGGPLDDPRMKAVSTMTGRDSGNVVFSVTGGRMLARERNGILAGPLSYVGGAQPFNMEQRFEYQSVITLLKR